MNRVGKPPGAYVSMPKDAIQRMPNWQTAEYFCDPVLLFSDNIVVKARKRRTP